MKLYSRLLPFLGLILLGLSSRFMPHPPNFTAMNAIALFGATIGGSLRGSFFLVFVTMFCSDLVFGLHPTIPYVYCSFGLTVLLGHWLKKEIHQTEGSKTSLLATARAPTPFLLLSSLLFFVISNFGVWMTTELYPKSLNGLQLCYIAALPFLQNQVLGDLCYGFFLFLGLHYKNKGLISKSSYPLASK